MLNNESNISYNDLLKVLEYREVSRREIEQEDYIVENYTFLGGHLDKDFYRCDSKIFKPLFDSLRSGNSSYISYLNEIIIENEDIQPNMVSCLIKDLQNKKSSAISEVVGSQIMNYFNAPTVFNAVSTINIFDEKWYYTMSADFVKEGDKYYLFDEYLNLDYLEIDINQLEHVDKIVKFFKKTKFQYDTYGQQKKKIIRDFIMSTLVRKLVINDWDFNERNCGIIFNDQKQSVQLINFDYEMGLAESQKSVFKSEFAEQIMQYVKYNFPKIYNEFIDKLKQLSLVENDVNKSSSDVFYNEAMYELFSNINNTLQIDTKLKDKKLLSFGTLKKFLSREQTL